MAFGDFQTFCTNVPSYPWCNLFYRQLQRAAPDVLTGVSANPISAPVGVNPTCGIPHSGQDGSIGNIANMVACGVSVGIVFTVSQRCYGRKAAVGRIELLIFLALYFISLPLQLLTTGSVLEQGSKVLTILTAIHVGVVVALFWALLANAIVATQVVEDGSFASLVPFGIFGLITFVVGLYISLDVAFGITTTIGGVSSPPESLTSIPLFVVTSIWPLACAVSYIIIMAIIVLHILKEGRPVWYYLLATALFVISQVIWFLAGRVICKGTNQKIDGSFIATILETGSVVVLYFAWKSITEESWDDNPDPPY